MFIRAQWAEMCGFDIPLKAPEEIVSKIKGVLVTDARSLYDIVIKGEQNASGLGVREKYSALELLSVLQRLTRCKTVTRWVHSEAQLADAMTKRVIRGSLHKALIDGQWTLVEDPEFTSAKKLRQLGVTSSVGKSSLGMQESMT